MPLSHLSDLPDDLSALNKAFGDRLKLLRKQHHWTQKELAAKLDVRYTQLNKYEGGLHFPPPDKLIKLAAIFNTSIDFLLTGSLPIPANILHSQLLHRFHALQLLPQPDIDAISLLIDALITKHRISLALSPIAPPLPS